jgi:hypothetical protein
MATSAAHAAHCMMPESLPFRVGTIEIVLDDEQKVDDTGTPVAARCNECGATSRSKIDALVYLVERRDLVTVANRLSRWDCVARGHGVPF